jgi:hypothetical protein
MGNDYDSTLLKKSEQGNSQWLEASIASSVYGEL